MSDANRGKQLIDILLETGLCTSEQLAVAHEKTGNRMGMLQALVEDGVVIEERLIRALSTALGLEVVMPASMNIHERVLSALPAEVALRWHALPIAMKRTGGVDYLYVAMADPLDSEAQADISRAAGCEVAYVIAPPSQLRDVVQLHYGAAASAAPARSNGNRIPAVLPSESPPPLPDKSFAPLPPPLPPRAASNATAAHNQPGAWSISSDSPKQVHLYDHRTGDIMSGKGQGSQPGSVSSQPGSVRSQPGLVASQPSIDPRDDLRDAILASGEHRISSLMGDDEPLDEEITDAPPVTRRTGPEIPVPKLPKLPEFRLDGLSPLAGSPIEGLVAPEPPRSSTEPTSRLEPPSRSRPSSKLSAPASPVGNSPLPTAQTFPDPQLAATVLDMPLFEALAAEAAAEAAAKARAMEVVTIDEDDDDLIPVDIMDEAETTEEEHAAISSGSADAFEVPVSFDPQPSPFDDLENVRHRPGLDKTGIIPLPESWLKGEFDPPQPGEVRAPRESDLPAPSGAAKVPSVQMGGSAVQAEEPEAITTKPTPSKPPPAPAKAKAKVAIPNEPTPSPAKPKSEKPSAPPKLEPQPAPDLPAPLPEISHKDLALSELEPPVAPKDANADLPPPRRVSKSGRDEVSPVFQSLLEPDAESTDRGKSVSPTKAQPSKAVTSPKPSEDHEARLVEQLVAGESSSSADRGRLVLALGRLLIQKGVITPEELVAMLRDT